VVSASTLLGPQQQPYKHLSESKQQIGREYKANKGESAQKERKGRRRPVRFDFEDVIDIKREGGGGRDTK